ncbi:MAG: CotH kinase family protein, partial [Prevotellaceae bacterium]|nr:CotH kinase family protein [Prevotellaceae bacterium]
MRRTITLFLLLASALLPAASLAEDWVDLTSALITNPSYDGSSNTGWTISADAWSTACSYGGQEFWTGTWDIYQSVSLPEGHYRLSVQGFYRPGDYSSSDALRYNSISHTSLLYAGQTSTPLVSAYSGYVTSYTEGGWWSYNNKYYPNNMEAGAYCFEQGKYNNSLEFDISSQSSLNIGVRNETYVYSNWTMIDNWKLECQFGGTYVSAVTLSPTSASLVAGQQLQLTASYTPTNASLKLVSWTSSDESVASVSTDGTVTAKAQGTATITATALDGGGASASCKVSVDSSTDRLSSLVITEIQSANIDQIIDPSWNYGGWVELYNAGSSWVSLTGCWVSDDASNLKQAHITEPIAIAPGTYYNLWFDHHDKYCPTQVDMKLDAEGGTFYLSDTDGNLVVSQTYPEAVSRCSYARKSLSGNDWAWTSTPTPEAANDGSTFCTERLEAPTIDKDSQIFGTTLTVCVNIPEGATLRYTTDGSAPTATNGQTSQTGLFYPSETTVYRFCLIEDGKLPSPVVTRSYIYEDKTFALPVMSVASANDNLYGDDYGIFVQGNGNGRAGNGQSVACNWNMDWDRPVNFEYINEEGVMEVNQETAMERCGGWSRAWTPYSFKIKANKQYELQSYLPYDFFEEKPYLKHKALQIRNGGNDTSCRIADAALQEIVLRSGLDVDCQAYQPIMHYINGKYAGVINMREPNNKHYVYANYGLDDDEIDQFEMSPDSGYVQKCGTYESMQRWYDLAKDCSDDAVYEELKQMVDIDEYCNYMAVCFFLGNNDWPQNNIKGFKPITDGGKYHLVILDLDQAFNRSSSTFTDFAARQTYTFDQLYGEDVDHITKEIEMVTIFLNMLQNESFRKQFIDTYCIVAGSVFEPTRCEEIINELANRVSDSQSIYSELYGEGSSPWSTANSLINNLSTNRQSTMISALKNYSKMGLSSTTAQSVELSSNISEARLLVNDIEVPTGYFNGQLFQPVTFKTEAPAGYKFLGWKLVEGTADAVSLIKKGSTWSYYDKGSLDNESWTSASYDHSQWQSGKAVLGYCSQDTMTTQLTKSLPCYYFSTTCQLDETPESDATFTLDYTVDDGFVIYINGTEAGRYNMPSGTVSYSTYATDYAEGNPDSGTMKLSASLFHEGTNLICVEVHNNSDTSSDIYWDASLTFASNATTGSYVSTSPEYDMPSSGSMVLQACFGEMSDEEKEEEGLSTAPIVINEVSAGNSVYVNEYFKKDDWVELYNTTDEDIDLEGVYISDTSKKPQKYRITAEGTKASTLIPAHGFKVVWCSQRETDTELHTSFKLSNDDGKLVRIEAEDGSWADSL